MKKLLLIIVLLLPGLFVTSSFAEDVKGKSVLYTCTLYVSEYGFDRHMGTGKLLFTFHRGHNMDMAEMEEVVKNEVVKAKKMYTEQGYYVYTDCIYRVLEPKREWGVGIGGGCGLQRAEQPMKNMTK